MSVLTKFLRMGEGKKLRALQSLAPDINALEPELEALSDEDLAHKTICLLYTSIPVPLPRWSSWKSSPGPACLFLSCASRSSPTPNQAK